MFFNRRKKNLEDKIKILHSEKKSLLSKNQNLLSNLELETNKLKRIEYLLNDRVCKNCKVFIETTTKGIPVLVAINENIFQIEIFDLIVPDSNHPRALILSTEEYSETCFIKDIQGGKSLGHGEIAMNHVITHFKLNKYKFIKGELAPEDINSHKDRLYAFYSKFGFTIDWGDGTSFGSIIKSL